jgi:hypothetical protein
MGRAKFPVMEMLEIVISDSDVFATLTRCGGLV